jgi:hypothetical protein
MFLWKDMDRRARRLGILDTKLAQGGAIFFALIVVKLVPQILTVSIWWFVALAVLCGIKPAITFFGGNEGQYSGTRA